MVIHLGDLLAFNLASLLVACGDTKRVPVNRRSGSPLYDSMDELSSIGSCLGLIFTLICLKKVRVGFFNFL